MLSHEQRDELLKLASETRRMVRLVSDFIYRNIPASTASSTLEVYRMSGKAVDAIVSEIASGNWDCEFERTREILRDTLTGANMVLAALEMDQAAALKQAVRSSLPN